MERKQPGKICYLKINCYHLNKRLKSGTLRVRSACPPVLQNSELFLKSLIEIQKAFLPTTWLETQLHGFWLITLHLSFKKLAPSHTRVPLSAVSSVLKNNRGFSVLWLIVAFEAETSADQEGLWPAAPEGAASSVPTAVFWPFKNGF